MHINTDPTKRLQTEIRGMIEEALGNAWISRKEAEFLDTINPRTPYFYCLPKIHKGKIPPPGRPIVSGTGSVLEPLSTFCDKFLQPIVQASTTYLKDTKDVLNLIETISLTTQVHALITLDVEALYTNIPQEATLEVVETALCSASQKLTTPAHFIMHCASLALKENFFQFEDLLFHQTRGTSMGSNFAPSLACLYMFDFESRFILPDTNPFQANIKLWRRYIDDILIVWQGSLSETNALAQPGCLTFTLPETLIRCFRDAELNTDPAGVPFTFQEPRTWKNAVRKCSFMATLTEWAFVKEVNHTEKGLIAFYLDPRVCVHEELM
ncbi:hypothetical protein NDU88_001011 [Pleurodeles waltl]|uniref:Reverse transcriptase domain-containing protein n=1 Tax=Pleurodeles waltl TaxID=8319 RepID=A0AAV7V6L8_PLEWA|nr:hypothetical protein NDU88_001011 [Pleurodeles waltl]